MQSNNHFSKGSWEIARSLEQSIDKNLGEYLIWHNKKWNGGQYDGKAKADFSIKNTDIFLEFQLYDFVSPLIIFKRKYYYYNMINNSMVYSKPKNLKNVYIVCSDGENFLIQAADKLKPFLIWTNKFKSYRNNGELASFCSIDKFIRLNLSEFKNKLKNRITPT